MNLNQIVNMIIRMFLRRGINWGINKGMKMASSRGKEPQSAAPEDAAQAQQLREAAKRARKSARLTRHL